MCRGLWLSAYQTTIGSLNLFTWGEMNKHGVYGCWPVTPQWVAGIPSHGETWLGVGFIGHWCRKCKVADKCLVISMWAERVVTSQSVNIISMWAEMIVTSQSVNVISMWAEMVVTSQSINMISMQAEMVVTSRSLTSVK